MSNGVFLLVLIALGFVFLIYFNRRAKNFRTATPGRKIPWTSG